MRPPRPLPPRPAAPAAPATRPLARPAPRPAAPVQSSAKPLARPPGRPGAPPARPANHAKGVSRSVNNGFDVARQQREEQERNAEMRKNRPFEYRMKVGETSLALNPRTQKQEQMPGVNIVILDNCLMSREDMPFFLWYHRWGYVDGQAGSGKEDICLKESPEGCPLCDELGREGNWEMRLSVIDRRPYTPERGPNAGKKVLASRKLLTAKSKMIPHFEELYRDHGKLRGMVVRMYRDGAKDEAIGSRLKFIKFLSEEELRKMPDGGVPVDYAKAYPKCTREELARRNKVANSGGSGGGAAGDADFAGTDDDIPF